jgi:RNA polymerase sigma-70 factor, ECF subfamily
MEAASDFAMEVVLDRSMSFEDNDHELIRQMAAGGENALRKMYTAYGQRLYAYALRITGDPAAAEEAVQETLVAAWQGAGRFRGEGRAIAWLLGIVHHKALNQIRRKPVDSLEAEPHDPPAGDPPPEALAAAQEQRRLVRAGLEGLSLEHRLVLELIFYQGLSLNEAAEVCGCPVGTIKSRLNYAKASLRGALNRAGLNAEDVA